MLHFPSHFIFPINFTNATISTFPRWSSTTKYVLNILDGQIMITDIEEYQFFHSAHINIEKDLNLSNLNGEEPR